jgi:RpiB/LacA/LacB family sugar-phosphate isomerase
LIFIGSDHRGFGLKEKLKLIFRDFEFEDLGTFNNDVFVDYPRIACYLAEKTVESGGLGILLCGSGIGVSIAANKVRGAYAALCFVRRQAELARAHNNANILCLGSDFLNEAEAARIVSAFLETSCEGGRHLERTSMISNYEKIGERV